MAIYYSNRPIVTDGLEYYVDAANTKSYPGTGNTWFDIAGVSTLYDGTLVNSPTISSEGLSSFDFNGTSQAIEIDAGVPFAEDDNVGNLTREVWFNCDDVTPNTEQIIWEDGGTSNGTSIYIHSGSLYAGLWSSSDGFSGAWPSSSIESGKWYHVCLSLLGAGSSPPTTDALKFHLNGSLVDTADSTWLNSHTDGTGGHGIGRINGGTKTHLGTISGDFRWFDGKVAMVRAYHKKGLTDAEVKQNFNALRGRFDI